MKKLKLCFFGITIGLINAVFGAGGGMIAVPVLKSLGLTQKQAQATAICIILPLSVISCAVYIVRGYVSLKDAYAFLPLAVIGAMLGTKLLKKANNKVLQKLFALFMLWAGIRMVIK